MEPVVKFCLENIYCASKQDMQFSFSLNRLTKYPVKERITAYNIVKQLPDKTFNYTVFAIGNIDPNILNLLKDKKLWYKDVWIKVSDDMVLRNYILQIYNSNGIMFPRTNIFYSFIDEHSILIAIRHDNITNSKFKDMQFNNMHIYSNQYFSTNEYLSSSVRLGIEYISLYVANNQDKVLLQTWITDKESNGGKCFIYVNGLIYDKLVLTIPNFSLIEIVYDQSVISKEYIPIGDLRQFTSTKNSIVSYLVNRDKLTDTIEYYDDSEVYITTSNLNNNYGVFYYRHKKNAMSMVTDKDYALNSTYVNTQATYLSEIASGAIQDKSILLYIRKSGLNRTLKYSNLKLHELYKLPLPAQLNVLNGTGYVLNDLRAEVLEDSLYFKVANSFNLFSITKELSTATLGYNAITRYFGNNCVSKDNNIIDVPELYQEPSYAYEYDITGKLLGKFTTSSVAYLINNPLAAIVEFIKGQTPLSYSRYYTNNEVIALEYTDYRIISALFNGDTRLTDWEDITESNRLFRSTNTVSLAEEQNVKAQVIYLNQPNTYDLDIDISQGYIYFPLLINQDRGNGIQTHIAEIPYTNIDIFLNGYRLVQGIDFFIDFPNVSICNKEYINTSSSIQKVHIRAYGFSLDKTSINDLETYGFVNHGVLSRNNVYDIRDDRVLAIYVDGKLTDRNTVTYAENDNTVRLDNPLNGKPYLITEPFISVKQVTGLDTYKYYADSKVKNKRFRDFFTEILPEPIIEPFNIIGSKHLLYSPVLSKLIIDLKEGIIPRELYTTPYNDSSILSLLDTNYADMLSIDVVKQQLDNTLVEIHPFINNVTIDLDLFQYRFIANVNRLLTNNKIELSGRINITT